MRIEDVALGSAVSLAVGVLFWPRGAGAALGKALAEAYADSARYLAGAVGYGLGRCDDCVPRRPPHARRRCAPPPPRAGWTTPSAAIWPSGEPNRSPCSEITGLVTGVAGVRLAADAVLELWERRRERRGRPLGGPA